MGLYTAPETYSPEQLWQMLLGYDRSSALLAASISSQVHLIAVLSFYGYGCSDCGYTRLHTESERRGQAHRWVVAGHAYSLIRVVEVGCVASGGCSLC